MTNLRQSVQELADRDYITVDSSGGCSFRIGYLKEWFLRWAKFDEQVEIYLEDTVQCLEHRARKVF